MALKDGDRQTFEDVEYIYAEKTDQFNAHWWVKSVSGNWTIRVFPAPEQGKKWMVLLYSNDPEIVKHQRRFVDTEERVWGKARAWHNGH